MIETKQLGSLEYLVCQDIPVPHCFTTRLGGISSGYLSSLNIGTSRGDDPNNVIENYRRLGDALGFDIHNRTLSIPPQRKTGVPDCSPPIWRNATV